MPGLTDNHVSERNADFDDRVDYDGRQPPGLQARLTKQTTFERTSRPVQRTPCITTLGNVGTLAGQLRTAEQCSCPSVVDGGGSDRLP